MNDQKILTIHQIFYSIYKTMFLYGLKYRKTAECINSRVVKKNKWILMLLSKCAVCHCKFRLQWPLSKFRTTLDYIFVKEFIFWKFNNSLIRNSDFVDEIKIFIHNTKIFLDQNNTLSNQSKWKFLKYEIRKRSIAFSKALAKRSKKEHALFLSKITKLEKDIDSEKKFDGYQKTKNELEKIYDKIAEGVKIRSKCSWYQHSE